MLDIDVTLFFRSRFFIKIELDLQSQDKHVSPRGDIWYLSSLGPLFVSSASTQLSLDPRLL